MKTIYNFQVCQAYHHTRTKALYNTICRKINERGEQFYLISGADTVDEIPLLKLADTDDYYSAMDKTLRCFLYHYENQTKFDFFFFGDDDTYINLKNLDVFIQSVSVDRLEIYGNIQRMFRFEDIMEDLHLTGGPGILMNRKTFLEVAAIIKKFYIKDRVFSDVSLALNIKKYNEVNASKIKIMSAPNFIQDHRWSHEAAPLLPENYHGVITYHLRSWLKDTNEYESVLKIYERLFAYE